MIIIENDEIMLSEENGRVFMTIKSDRYNLKKVDELTRNHPRLKISNFLAVKKAVESGSHDPIELGTWIDSMELEISSDKMQAFITIYESQNLYTRKHRKSPNKFTKATSRQSNYLWPSAIRFTHD